MKVADYTASIGSSTWDIETNYVTWNNNLCLMHGITPEEFDGQFETVMSFIHPDDLAQVRDKIQQLMDDKQPIDFEYRIITNDRVEKTVWCCQQVFLNDTGKIERMIGVIQDVTSRKTAKTQMVENEMKFTRIFHLSPIPYIISSLKTGDYIDVNEAFLDFFGYRRDEIIGESSDSINYWDNPVLREELIRIIEEKGRVKNFEIKVNIKSGEMRNVLFSAEIITLDKEQFLLSVINDITPLRLAREKQEKLSLLLKENQKKLEHKSIALEQLSQHADFKKKRFGKQMQSNIGKIILPLLSSLEEGLTGDRKHIVTLIRNNLVDIASPYLTNLEENYTQLSQRDLQLCNMVKNNYSSKQIARLLILSEETIRARRKSVRLKLGINKSKIRLRNFLQKH